MDKQERSTNRKTPFSIRTWGAITTAVSQNQKNLLFLLVLLVGVIARLWEFGSLPPGLNPDEASIGVEAYYLFQYGVDRNGMSYPVHLISWGSGQNSLYAYLILPLVALKGIKVMPIRLPMLIAGILSILLIYFRFGLYSIFSYREQHEHHRVFHFCFF